jgi:asparagine synthase (glutamine-hydrolysing)
MPYSRADPKHAGVLRYGGSFPGAYLIERGVFKPWELHHVLSRELVAIGKQRLSEFFAETDAALGQELNGFAKVSLLESWRYMRNQLLRDSDWTGMAHSLEIRVPFVDSVLTEAIAGLAATGRFDYGKAVLASTLSKGLPAAVLQRPKTGFIVPLWKWLRKCPDTAGWKRVRFLCRPNVPDASRWAYNVLAQVPDAAGLLKS